MFDGSMTSRPQVHEGALDVHRCVLQLFLLIRIERLGTQNLRIHIFFILFPA